MTPALPADHPLRIQLNDEVHARPPESLVAPTRLTYLALFSDMEAREGGFNAVCALAERFGAVPPSPGANHYSADLGPFRVKWERHTEFHRYKFIVSGTGTDPFDDPASAAGPADWRASLPGQVMGATHVALLPQDADEAQSLAAARRRERRGGARTGRARAPRPLG